MYMYLFLEGKRRKRSEVGEEAMHALYLSNLYLRNT